MSVWSVPKGAFSPEHLDVLERRAVPVNAATIAGLRSVSPWGRRALGRHGHCCALRGHRDPLLRDRDTALRPRPSRQRGRRDI